MPNYRMPNYSTKNLISVTQSGPDILDPVRSAISSPVGQEAVGGFRKAGAVLKGNPLSLLLSELIFPQPFADGTLKGATKKDGYELMPYRPDPETDKFLKQQKSQMDAGISGTFLPVQ